MIVWIVLHLVKDACWVYVQGTESVIATASLMFACLFVFLALKWKARIVFAGLTLFVLALVPLEPGNPVAAAESRAASILRATVTRLEEYREQSPNGVYPSTLAIETRGYENRYYRYSYVPLHSHADSKIDGFLLTARPRRYRCGRFESFTVGSDGKFHVTQEDREANLNDPVFN